MKTAGIKAISTATSWISKNKGVVLAIIAPLTLYIAKVTLLKTRLLLLTAAEKAGVVIKALEFPTDKSKEIHFVPFLSRF